MNNNSVKTKCIPIAAAIASIDPLRTIIDIEPVPGVAEWTIICTVTCPNAQELFDRVHPAVGQPVKPLQSDPMKALAINRAIFRTSARLRDRTSGITRIICAEVVND